MIRPLGMTTGFDEQLATYMERDPKTYTLPVPTASEETYELKSHQIDITTNMRTVLGRQKEKLMRFIKFVHLGILSRVS